MSNKIPFLIISVLILTGCTLFKRKSDINVNKTPIVSWDTIPHSTTTMIRLTSTLSEDDIKRECINKVSRAKFTVDMNASFLSTEIKRIDNYYVRIHISVKDSVAVFSGEYGNKGLNATWGGEEASSSNIAWEDIKMGSKGWNTLKWLSELIPHKRIDYDK